MKIQFSILLVLIQLHIYAQDIYYVSPDTFPWVTSYSFGKFNINTCTDSTIITSIELGPDYDYVTDIAVCPDKNFYITCSGFGSTKIARLNLPDSTITIVASLFYSANSLVCNDNGLLIGGATKIQTINPQSGVVTVYSDLANVGNLSGDLTFLNGKLYGTTINNQLIEIDYLDSTKCKVILNYPIGQSYALGVTAASNDCDSAIVYITITDELGIPTFNINQIYAIDIEKQTLTFVCNTPNIIYGSTSFTENQAADCKIHLDLDENNDSGALGNDFKSPPQCQPVEIGIPICDILDTRLIADNLRIDSIQIQILTISPKLFLTAAPIGTLIINNLDKSKITIIGNKNTPSSVENISFESCLKSIRVNNNGFLAAGVYQVGVYVFGANNRFDTAFSSFQVLEIPIITAVTQEICRGQFYTFNNQDFTTDTLLCDTIQSINGCDSITCTPIVFKYKNEVLDSSICFGQTIIWNGINILQAGIYVDTLSINGCLTIQRLKLSVESAPFSVSVGKDIFLEEGKTYKIPLDINRNGNFIYSWQPELGLNCTDCPNPVASFLPLDSITYKVIVTDSNGCKTSDAFTIRLLSTLKILAPNVFTPNQDGVNDYFNLFADSKIAQRIDFLQIYDRWGELVFERKNIEINKESDGWNGEFRGKIALTGVYIWTARIRLVSGEIVKMSGDLSLIR